MTHSFSRTSFLPPLYDGLFHTHFPAETSMLRYPSLCLNITFFTLLSDLKHQALCFGDSLSEDADKKMGDLDCPACAENQAVLLFPVGAVCVFIFCNRWIHFSWFQASLPLPFSPLVWNNIWFCLPASWLECWSQCHWHFREEMAFSFLGGCYTALTSMTWVGGKWGRVSYFSELLLSCSLK